MQLGDGDERGRVVVDGVRFVAGDSRGRVVDACAQPGAGDERGREVVDGVLVTRRRFAAVSSRRPAGSGFRFGGGFDPARSKRLVMYRAKGVFARVGVRRTTGGAGGIGVRRGGGRGISRRRAGGQIWRNGRNGRIHSR